MWTTDQNALHAIGEDGIGVHNRCRNPGKDPKGLWCYVEGSKYFEYCNATVCPEEYRVNHTNIDNMTGEDAAVSFLYGPLIIGICAGMITLVLIIVLADCIRKKKICAGNQKTKNINVSGGVDTSQSTDTGKPLPDGLVEDDNVKTLGGIVTVNVDTGEQKRQSKLDITSLKSQQTKSLYDARSISSSLASEEKKSREKATSSFNTRTSDTVSLPATRHTSSSRHPRTRRVYMGETSI